MKLRIDLSKTIQDLDGKPLPIGGNANGLSAAHVLGDMLVMDKGGPILDFLMLAMDLRKSPVQEITTALRDQVKAAVEQSQQSVILVKGQILQALARAEEAK